MAKISKNSQEMLAAIRVLVAPKNNGVVYHADLKYAADLLQEVLKEIEAENPGIINVHDFSNGRILHD